MLLLRANLAVIGKASEEGDLLVLRQSRERLVVLAFTDLIDGVQSFDEGTLFFLRLLTENQIDMLVYQGSRSARCFGFRDDQFPTVSQANDSGRR